jgi:hypothetical protein
VCVVKRLMSCGEMCVTCKTHSGSVSDSGEVFTSFTSVSGTSVQGLDLFLIRADAIVYHDHVDVSLRVWKRLPFERENK